MNRAALVALFACSGGCTISVDLARIGEGVEQVEVAIAIAWQDHIAAAQSKDVCGVCALYAEDVFYAVQGQPDVRGRAAVEAMERSGMEANEVVDAGHFTIALQVDGGIAHELGAVSGNVASAGQPAHPVVFLYAAAWRCGEDGVWRIANLVGHVEGTVAR